MENTKPPITEPYKVLFIGFDVIAQVPVLQPTNFQYKNPAMVPNDIPMMVKRFFFINVFITVLVLLLHR